MVYIVLSYYAKTQLIGHVIKRSEKGWAKKTDTLFMTWPTSLIFIIWKKIIAAIDATPLQLRKESLKNLISFRNCKSCVYNCDDLLSYYSSPRSSHIWFSYIHNFIIILLQVYNEPIQRPAPSWLVSSTGRALHLYRRGKGFESRTSPKFFFHAFFSQLQKLRL